jgi:DNA-binding MurR/RpiR family transcriptional regulator
MAEVADACLVYDAKESLLETGSIAVKMAQFFVLDLLYTQVVKAMGDTAIENKRKTAQAFRMTEQL